MTLTFEKLFPDAQQAHTQDQLFYLYYQSEYNILMVNITIKLNSIGCY